ncbi:hypothetical protein Goarm_017547 [Gossypium armourianum]|uniref:Uncharacterized protein n=1 Tax=Gossypium armourianum TaxID=34283 RepID=A0A7J9JFN8_9ROSI|nr:hypothetical protein [Gossypium armourianum]
MICLTPIPTLWQYQASSFLLCLCCYLHPLGLFCLQNIPISPLINRLSSTKISYNSGSSQSLGNQLGYFYLRLLLDWCHLWIQIPQSYCSEFIKYGSH